MPTDVSEGTYTVVFTPDDLTTYQPKGIQTVVQINPATLWVFPVLSTNHILLNEAIPTATGVSFDGIAEGDSMRTDVQPQISINEKPLLAGMYQIRITNTAEFLADLKSERQAVLEIRSHVGWYLKGVKGSNEIKNKIYKMTKICDILQVLEKFKEEVYEEEKCL